MNVDEQSKESMEKEYIHISSIEMVTQLRRTAENNEAHKIKETKSIIKERERKTMRNVEGFNSKYHILL